MHNKDPSSPDDRFPTSTRRCYVLCLTTITSTSMHSNGHLLPVLLNKAYCCLNLRRVIKLKYECCQKFRLLSLVTRIKLPMLILEITSSSRKKWQIWRLISASTSTMSGPILKTYKTDHRPAFEKSWMDLCNTV
jgi:hypothetical protein